MSGRVGPQSIPIPMPTGSIVDTVSPHGRLGVRHRCAMTELTRRSRLIHFVMLAT